jgi:hypothetical protein
MPLHVSKDIRALEPDFMRVGKREDEKKTGKLVASRKGDYGPAKTGLCALTGPFRV